VFIGGYSQGATIALLAFLTGGVQVDGLVILRGWVARGQSISQVSRICFTKGRQHGMGLMGEELKGGHETTPVFWAAGEEDDVVTLASTYSVSLLN
jgi:predicted esterase